MKSQSNSCVFFDRDGVLIKDVHLLIKKSQIKIFNETFEAFRKIRKNDSILLVITNQTVIARGLATEENVSEINEFINNQIYTKTGAVIKKFYYCPHHPHADIKKYRTNCECRKPKTGMLLKAASEYNIDLKKSWMVGDRISDIIAGYNAGCKTILVETGKHLEEPIESDEMDLNIKSDFRCKNILEAVKIILNKK